MLRTYHLKPDECQHDDDDDDDDDDEIPEFVLQIRPR